MKSIFILTTILISITCFGQPGRLDTTFNYNPHALNYQLGECGIAGPINDMIKQPDGKIILVGEFIGYNGVDKNRVIRINSNGSLDQSFTIGTGASGAIRDVVLQPDGKIIIVGEFDYFNGITRKGIARLNTNGSLDLTFDAGSGANSDGIFNVILMSDLKVVVMGHFTTFNGQNINQIARLNSDGTLDNTFQSVFSQYATVSSPIKQLDEKLIVCSGSLITLNTDGTIDTGSNLTNTAFLNGYPRRLLQLANGKLLVSGSFEACNGIPRMGLALFNEDGTLDSNFDPGSGAAGGTVNLAYFGDHLQDMKNIFALKERSDGKIVLAGNFTSYNGVVCKRMALINPDGSLHTPIYGFYYGTEFRSLLVNDDLSFFGGGNFLFPTQHILKSYLLKFTDSGELDNHFLPERGASNEISLMKSQSDHKIIIAGLFSRYNNFMIAKLARLHEDGTIDTSFFNSITGGDIRDFAIQADGKIVVVGNFTSCNSDPSGGIARLLSTGETDPSFQVGTGADGIIFSVNIDSDGKILLGGTFLNFNGSPYTKIIRLNSDGTVDNTFQSVLAANILNTANSSTTIKVSLIQPDGKILIGTNNNTGIYRLNEDGSEDVTFQYNGNNTQPIDLDLGIDGKILVSTGDHIFRLLPNGSVDNSFSNEYTYFAYSSLIQPDGGIVVNAHGELITLDPNGHILDRFDNVTTQPGLAFPIAVNYGIQSIGLQRSGKLLVSGNFTYFQGKMVNGIARLNNINLQLTLDSIVELGCNTNGELFVDGQFGSQPYVYEWINPPNTFTNHASIDSSGIYTCKVTDAIGDTAFININVTGPNSMIGIDLKAESSFLPFRPGFASTVWINAFNDGCVPASGQLKLAYDPLLDFISSTPAPTAQSGDTLIWDFTDITYDSAHLTPQIVFNTSTQAVIGDTIHFTTIITPIAGDADTTNNVKYYSSPVVNGYDPNIKSVYPVGKCDVGYIKQDQLLTYTVQFQNTGNSEAINIAVIDSLDTDLDLNTVRVVGGSHPMWTEILPGNVLKFHFDNINLPDSTNNEPESHGYVIFEVKPVSTWLNQNTEISNLADIYFDFNPPIRTNEVSNLIFQNDLDNYTCLGAGIEETSVAELMVFPNPANNLITIRTNQEFMDETVLITDLQGKIVLSKEHVNGFETIIDLSGLTNGIYLIRTQTNPVLSRLVKQ